MSCSDDCTILFHNLLTGERLLSLHSNGGAVRLAAASFEHSIVVASTASQNSLSI